MHNKKNTLFGQALIDSNNLYANSLTKAMGQIRYHVGSMKAGVNAILDTLIHHHLLKPGQLILEDGAGLSTDNLVTPAAIAQVLMAIQHHHAWYRIFANSLPLAGIRGTLKNRLQQPDVRRRVLAKTGTLNHVSNLSGYLQLPQQHWILVILTNNVANLTAARQAQYTALRCLAAPEDHATSTLSSNSVHLVIQQLLPCHPTASTLSSNSFYPVITQRLPCHHATPTLSSRT